MNIAVSFSGEGRGHSTRMGALCRHLLKKHNICYWCPENISSFFRSIIPDARIYPIPLISLVKLHHRVLMLKTAKLNIRPLFLQRETIDNIVKQLNGLDISLVISDYEPFLPRAARIAKIPVLALNHQLATQKHISPFDMQGVSQFVANSFMMPYYSYSLSSSFFDGDIGPILREHIKLKKPSHEDFYVVYLKGRMEKIARKTLKKLGLKYLSFPDKNHDFADSIASCKGVISAAGHQIISECLHLNKPIFSIPERSQFEQILNAQMLARSGRGTIFYKGKLRQKLKAFIKKIGSYPFHEPDPEVSYIFHDDTENALTKIKGIISRIKG